MSEKIIWSHGSAGGRRVDINGYSLGFVHMEHHFFKGKSLRHTGKKLKAHGRQNDLRRTGERKSLRHTADKKLKAHGDNI